MKTADHTADVPQNLSELNEAILACLGRFFEGTGQEPSHLVTLRRREGELVLKANLSELEKLQVHLALGDDDISFRGHSRHCAVSLKAFRARVRPWKDLLTVIFLPRGEEPLDWALQKAVSASGREVVSTFQRITEQLNRPRRSVFLHRALNALVELSEDAPTGSLESAATAPTDLRVLLRILEAPETLKELEREDPLAKAKLRGIRARRELLELHGRPWTTIEVAKSLNMSRQAVDKRRRAGQLLGLNLGRRGYLFPSWQFTDRGTLTGLDTVLGALSDHDSWMKLAFMVNPNARLNMQSPLDELNAGRIDAVLEAARSFGEHGAA